MLKIKDMNLNNVIRQGDSQPREYQLDTGNLDLNLTNKSATIRLMTADFQGIGYETTATVSSENKISFSIDDVIPARQYRLEVTVDDYVFPSRATDGQFNIDPSSHGQEVNIIQIIGKDEIVREVKEQIEPFLGEVEQAELVRQAQEEARETAEAQRKIDHANRSAEFDGKADKVVLKNLVENGDFVEGTNGWTVESDASVTQTTNGAEIISIKDSTQIYQFVSGATIGDIVYTAILAKSDTPSNYVLSTNQSGASLVRDNTDYHLVSVREKRINNLVMSITRYDLGDGVLSSIYIKYMVCINLTKTFGVGNEPTKEQMDELIKVTGYIDEEYALNNKEMLVYLMKGKGYQEIQQPLDVWEALLTNENESWAI